MQVTTGETGLLHVGHGVGQAQTEKFLGNIHWSLDCQPRPHPPEFISKEEILTKIHNHEVVKGIHCCVYSN